MFNVIFARNKTTKIAALRVTLLFENHYLTVTMSLAISTQMGQKSSSLYFNFSS